MKLKKTMGLLLVAVMLLSSVFTGCSKDNKSENPGEKVTGKTEADTSKGSEDTTVKTNTDREKVNIRFAQFGNSTDDPDGMKNDPIKAKIEEAVNITLEYDTGAEGFDERMSTELSVGVGPDLFPTWADSELLKKWSEDEVIVNLAEIVNAEPERYPTLYKMFNDESYKAFNKMYTGDENAVYAIYAMAAYAKPVFAGVPVYNTAILNEVNGGKVPATVDEFIAYCNAAGEAGYVGWWPRNDKLTNWNEIDKTLAAPQGTSILAPASDLLSGFVQTSQDKWELATVSDKSKDVVKQLASLYANGGLDKNIGVKGDFDDAYGEFGLGRIGAANFGFGFATQYRDFYNSCWVAANPDAKTSDLTMGLSLTDDGKYGTTYSSALWMGAHYMIPASCKNPDRVLDLVEYLATNEGQDLLFAGIEGQTYTVNADGTYTYDVNKWAEINKAYGYSEPDRARYVWFSYLFCATEYKTNFEDTSWYESSLNPYDNTNDWAEGTNKELVDYAQSVIDTYVDKVVSQLPVYYMQVTLPAEADDIRSKLAEITNRYLTAFLGGQMDIDTKWQNYVEEYEAAGAKELEAIINNAVAAAAQNAQ